MEKQFLLIPLGQSPPWEPQGASKLPCPHLPTPTTVSRFSSPWQAEGSGPPNLVVRGVPHGGPAGSTSCGTNPKHSFLGSPASRFRLEAKHSCPGPTPLRLPTPLLPRTEGTGRQCAGSAAGTAGVLQARTRAPEFLS